MCVVRTDEYNANIINFNDPFEINLDGNNIALLEDGSEVNTATINCGLNGIPGGDDESNCPLFISNVDGSIDIAYNGFTAVLNATTMVIYGFQFRT